MSYLGVLKSWTTMLITCYLVVVCLVLPPLCRRLPFSLFYDRTLDSREHLLSLNAARVRRAQDGLHNATLLPLVSPVPAVASPELCVVVITARRATEIFTLTQVVASVAPQVAAASREVLFAVYNVDGAAHTEAVELGAHVPVFTSSSPPEPRSFDKERRDYIVALEWCHDHRPQFVVVLEDDALPPANFLSRLNFVLDHRMDKHSKEWAMLKLFYPEKYEGWSNELAVLLELVAATVAGGLLLTLLSLCLLPLSPSQRAPLLCVRLLASLLFTLLLLYAVGRPHWLALRGLSVYLSAVVHAPGCCTPAVVYPSWHLPRLLRFLQTQHCSPAHPLDLALDAFTLTNQLQSWLVVPNMVVHVGFVSSLPGKGWKRGQAQA